MSRYQWTVLFAAWLGWGFDVFDGLLFNYVAPNCVPTLLGLPLGTPAAGAATLKWGGILTSILLLGWAAGGILFGQVADRIGRTRTLMLTMLLYALGTAACATAQNMGMLIVFRIIASLGIGGEWAAGAAMVAEVVPERRRVEAGALLYTSAPAGLILATYTNHAIAGGLFKGAPEVSWRYVFLCGLLPAVVAFVVRLFVREPERWVSVSSAKRPTIAELFTPEVRRLTLSGFSMALIALIMWWGCSAFLPMVSAKMALATAASEHLNPAASRALAEQWKTTATNWFSLGGLVGTLLTVPVAKTLGRRWMFGIYYAASGLAIIGTFYFDIPAAVRLHMWGLIGLTVFGVFGSFTYYLPELFPTRLRGTGAGFCYNSGRIIASLGPFLVGAIASQADSLGSALRVLCFVGLVPLVGLLLLPLAVETKGRELA
jgi:MFS family permease